MMMVKKAAKRTPPYAARINDETPEFRAMREALARNGHALFAALLEGEEEADTLDLPDDFHELPVEERSRILEAATQAHHDEELGDPRRRGWSRLREVLESATRDAVVHGNPDAHAFAYAMLQLCTGAKRLTTVDDLALRLCDALLKISDTGKYIQDAALHEGRSKGGKNKGGKLPPSSVLRQELSSLMANRGLSEKDAKSVLRKKYVVTSQGLNDKLKK